MAGGVWGDRRVSRRRSLDWQPAKIQFNKVAGVHIGSGSRLHGSGEYTFGFQRCACPMVSGVFNASGGDAGGEDQDHRQRYRSDSLFQARGCTSIFSHAIEFRDGAPLPTTPSSGAVVSGSAHIFNTVITGNGNDGISAPFGSKLAIDGATISSNKGNVLSCLGYQRDGSDQQRNEDSGRNSGHGNCRDRGEQAGALVAYHRGWKRRVRRILRRFRRVECSGHFMDFFLAHPILRAMRVAAG